MRVVLVSSLLPADTGGGAEAYVELIARSLAETHDVLLLTGSRQGPLPGITTVELPGLPPLGRSTPLPGRMLWHARDQWLPRVHMAMTDELKRFGPHVVATHHPQGLSAAVFTAIRRLAVPHVHTAHDLNLMCARTTMTRDGQFCGGRCRLCSLQRVSRRAAIGSTLKRLIGVSRYICRRHVEAGFVTADRAETIRLGAEPGATRERMPKRASIHIGFLGTLGAHKGVLTLLRAFRAAPATWRLSIAGDGPLRVEVEAAAAADSRIEWHGPVHGADKERFFDAIDLLVVPSEWEEPATFVIVEAAVRGIPAVASDRGGLPEAPEVRLFRSGSAGGLLEQVAWYAEEPERVRQASARLIARNAEFCWSSHAKRVEAVLSDAGKAFR